MNKKKKIKQIDADYHTIFKLELIPHSKFIITNINLRLNLLLMSFIVGIIFVY